jgi:hypothetical protein
MLYFFVKELIVRMLLQYNISDIWQKKIMQSDLQFSCIGLFDGRVVFRVMNEWERESYGQESTPQIPEYMCSADLCYDPHLWTVLRHLPARVFFSFLLSHHNTPAPLTGHQKLPASTLQNPRACDKLLEATS